MKKEYKAHPLMILSLMKPFIFVLIFPVIRGVISYFIGRTITGVIIFEILLSLIIGLSAFLSYRAFRLVINEDFITIKKGFIFTREASIKINRLSSVEIKQNPLDVVFSAVTFTINTEAGRKNTPDFRFKLGKTDSKEIFKIVFGNKESRRIKYSVLKIALLAATTSSAFMGLVIGVPIINKVGDLLGIGISKMLFNEINNVTYKFSRYVSPIINAVSLIFLLGYAVSFLYSFVKYINFSLKINDDKLEVNSGFFVKSHIAFKRNSINNVRIEQTPLMRIFKRYAMKVSVGGYGDSKSESEVIVPAANLKNITEEFNEYFPFLSPKGKEIKAPDNKITRSRFLVFPSVLLLMVSSVYISLGFFYEDFGELILFLSILSLVAVFYYAYLSLCIQRLGKIQFGDTVFAHSIKKLRICRLYCPKENLGHIKITRFFADFKHNTCRVKITVCSENADTIKLKMLKLNQVRDEIKKTFNVDV